MRPTRKRARVSMELIVKRLRAATMANQRAIVTPVIDFAIEVHSATVEATALATPHVTDVTKGRFSVTHSR
jgi:hypothetical protein